MRRKRIADYVADVLAKGTREERRRELERVPHHQRKEVERWVKQFWAQKKQKPAANPRAKDYRAVKP